MSYLTDTLQDKNSDKETANVIFNRVREAYETLSNQESRNMYDMALLMKSLISDDQLSTSEETASTVFDVNENLFESFTANFDCFKDIIEEYILPWIFEY